MSFEVRIVKDSIGPTGKRLTSLLATYPRFIHSEVLTHRMFARNSASSRAIPWAKMRERIMKDPVLPIHWGVEQKGMQSGEVELEGFDRDHARREWLRARDVCLEAADVLHALGLHKSLCNRLTEPWMWMTTLITATEWQNFFRLRVHPAAERHFQKIAGMIQAAMQASEPEPLSPGEWHLPFITDQDWDEVPGVAAPLEITSMEALKRVSGARCARLSYLTHEGRRSLEEDLGLFSRLIERNDDVIHASPLEHVARAMSELAWCGPFQGWWQYRKAFAAENVEG